MIFVLNISNQKRPIYLDQIQAEKIMLILSQVKKPQFIIIDGEMVNTSFITSILIDTESNIEGSSGPPVIESKEDEQVHQKFINLIDKTNDIKMLK